MTANLTKGHNLTTPVPIPTLHGPTPEPSEDGSTENSTSTHTATALITVAFRNGLLVLLHKDIGDIMKTEIRSIMESEPSAIRADISAAGSELKSYQNTKTMKLTLLKGTACEMECSLSCKDVTHSTARDAETHCHDSHYTIKVMIWNRY